MHIVDIHTHVFSPEVIAGRDAYCQRDAWFGQLYADPRARLASPGDLLRSMEGAEIAASVICGFPWTDPGICRAENDFLLQAAAASGGRLVAFPSVSPARSAALEGKGAAASEAQRCLEAGARGIGELNATAQGFRPDDAALLRPLMDVLWQYRAPLLLHAGEPVGRGYPGKTRSTLQGFCRLAEAFPSNPIVLAHWGGGLLFYELMPEVERLLANVYYDTAASAYLYRPAVFAVAASIEQLGKVLFGSDYPVLSQRRMLDQVRGRALPPAGLESILGGNARKLLGEMQPVSET